LSLPTSKYPEYLLFFIILFLFTIAVGYVSPAGSLPTSNYESPSVVFIKQLGCTKEYSSFKVSTTTYKKKCPQCDFLVYTFPLCQGKVCEILWTSHHNGIIRLTFSIFVLRNRKEKEKQRPWCLPQFLGNMNQQRRV